MIVKIVPAVEEVVGGGGEGGAGAAEGDVQRREVRRDGAGAGGGDDSGLGLPEQPLDGLTVGLVAELARQLEHPRRASRRHPDPPPPPLHLGVSVLRRWSLGLGGARRW